MLRVTMNKAEKEIHFNNIDTDKAIFVKHNDKLVGMVIFDYSQNGCKIRIGLQHGLGYFTQLKDCIEDGINRGYQFYVEE